MHSPAPCLANQAEGGADQALAPEQGPGGGGSFIRQRKTSLKEVELVKHGELVAKLVKLHHSTTGVGSRTPWRSSRARPRYVWGHGVAYAYANVQDEQQPTSWMCMLHGTWGCSQVGALQPMIGRKLRKAGADRGMADGHGSTHGVGITCSDIDGA
jgi:hypothetical protein